ncbi:hypothetical protein LY474_17675 [Myxococcus stipitatus]|uniref:hypothetical protein n=1 Tax=Myxococcus stipitatus TaxID=83455 RepID=UPI001F38AC4A|nr:hypothetical protein [Myxococcus stipitatus]MCE9669628.1 hypothetical protein [Myxococcus stipitatus]
MSRHPLKWLLSGLALLAAPVALADSSTSIPVFQSRVAAARAPSSPGGVQVLRAELVEAINALFYDDLALDAAERAFLGDRIHDLPFNVDVTASAQKYLIDFHELNDLATTSAPLGLEFVAPTPQEQYGVSGPLAAVSEVAEGYIPNGLGVANQITLRQKAAEVFLTDNLDYLFIPITPRELIQRLSTPMSHGTALPDEVDGAASLITQISRNSNRLYVLGWSCERCGGSRGLIVAAVSTDRRFVRMVKFRTYVD